MREGKEEGEREREMTNEGKGWGREEERGI